MQRLTTNETARFAARAGQVTHFFDAFEVGNLPAPVKQWLPLLPQPSQLELVMWLVARVTDARACYATFYQGSGWTGEELVRVRFLTNVHGLRPIRVRLVAYIVTKGARSRELIQALVGNGDVESLLKALRIHDGKTGI